MLAELLVNHKDWIVTYHEHDSLLENQIDAELTEEERKLAWEEYEAEKKGLIQHVAMPSKSEKSFIIYPGWGFSSWSGFPGNPSRFDYMVNRET